MQISSPSRWRRDPISFIEECVINPATGRPFVLYPEQKQFIKYAFELRPDGTLKRNNWTFSAHKKSGKSSLAAQIICYVAVVLAPSMGQIHIISNDFEQSVGVIFRILVEIIRMSPRLRPAFAIAASRITVRATGVTIVAVASEYRSFSGANPTLNVFDEGAYYNSENARRMYDEGMPSPALRFSARLNVSTAGFSTEPSPLLDVYRRVVEGGIELVPEFYQRGRELVFWSHRLLPPWVDAEWSKEKRETLPGTQFDRLILNRWTSNESAAFSMEQWDACVAVGAAPLEPRADLEVYLGFDVGLRHDSSVIIGLCWEHECLRLAFHRIFTPLPGTTLPIEETLESTILGLHSRYRIRCVAYDPWQAVMLSQRLARAGINMVEYGQTSGNLTIAASSLIDLIRQRKLSMYADSALRDAAMKTILIESSRGLRLGKSKASDRVDPIVAMAFAATAALQRKGFGPARTATFGSSPAEALFELFGSAQHAEDLPAHDVGFATVDGQPLPRPEPPDPYLLPAPDTVLVSNWRNKGIAVRINAADYRPERDGMVIERS